jgi:CelD/BcsL family acetyltransferase involved in cellulose biosynthesis
MTAMGPHGEREIALELVSESAAFAALREEWDELLQDSDADGLFLTWEWQHSWWKHLGGRRRLMVVAARAGRRLVALAPMALRRAALRATPPLGCLELLGSGTAGSDHLDVIARRGWEPAAARSLAGAFTGARQLLALTRLRSGSFLARSLAPELETLGWRAQLGAGEVCPFIQRPAGGFAGYLAGLGAGHRHDYKRKLQALHKRHRVSFTAAAGEPERRESLGVLIDLHQQRWRGRGRSEAFASAELLAFHQELSALALGRGWLRLFVLRLDGQPAAALYGFRYGGVFSFFQSGFDPRWEKQSVGLVTMGLSIESAFAEGALEFDLLHGDEPYKFHWAKQVHQLTSAQLFPPGPRGLVLQGVAALARGARLAGRRLLRPTSLEGPLGASPA